jgi:putative hydrolase of the HAD superfamily
MAVRPFVFFDVGNTLIAAAEPIPVIYARTLNAHGAATDAETLGPIFSHVWRGLDAVVESGHDRYARFPGAERGFWREFLRRVLAAARIDVPLAPILDELFETFRSPSTWRVYDDVRSTLTALRDDGAGLGVISNWDRRLTPLLDGLGLGGYFEVAVVSQLVGVEKPDRRIFQIAAERAGAAAGSCVHVGDSVHFDVDGARGAGFRAILVDRGESGPPTDFQRGPREEAGRGAVTERSGDVERMIVLPDLGRVPEIVRGWSF